MQAVHVQQSIRPRTIFPPLLVIAATAAAHEANTHTHTQYLICQASRRLRLLSRFRLSEDDTASPSHKSSTTTANQGKKTHHHHQHCNVPFGQQWAAINSRRVLVLK